MIDLVVAFVGTVALRILYRFLDRSDLLRDPYPLEGDQGDVTTHLLAIDLIRRNGHRIPDETPQFLLSTGFDYPAAFHKLLSYVPKPALERLEPWISPLLEGVHAAAVYGMATALIGVAAPETPARALAGWVTASFVLAPLLSASPRRGAVLGERCFGFLFGHLCLFGLFWGLAFEDRAWLGVALVSFWIVQISSKFALQAVVFVAIGYALLRGQSDPVLFIGVGLVSGTIVSGGYALRVLRGTLHHSNFYRTFLVGVHDYTQSFSMMDLLRGAGLVARGRLREGIRRLRRHPLHRFPWLVPTLIPCLLLLVLAPPSREMEGAPIVRDMLAAWSLAVVVVGLLTTTDPLKFLGEGERYLEYAILPTAVVTVLWEGGGAGPVRTTILLFSAAYVALAYLRSGPVSSGGPAARELRAWFARQPSSTLCAIPGRLGHALCYGTSHRLIWWFINAPRGPVLRQWKALFDAGGVYPFPSPGALARASREHGADLVVIDKDAVEGAREAWGLEYDFEGRPIRFENERFLVVRAEDAGRSS